MKQNEMVQFTLDYAHFTDENVLCVLYMSDFHVCVIVIKVSLPTRAFSALDLSWYYDNNNNNLYLYRTFHARNAAQSASLIRLK